VNYKIHAPKVQVIDDQKGNLGILDKQKAIQIAQDKGLDLVEIAPTAKPPVCKIIDYGKYKYQQSKKEQKQKAKQKKTEVKGIRIGLSTSSHDLEYKAKQADKFLNQGNKVRIEIKLRGREKAHQDLAKQKLNEFREIISTNHKIEQEPEKNPMGMAMTIAKS